MPRKSKALPKVKKNRRARGTGSIFPDKRRGGYLARVPIGKLPNGKTRYKEVRGDTQAEVVAKMKGVAPPDPNSVTVGEWLDRWLTTCTAARPTKALYEIEVRLHLKPQLGSIRLRELTTFHIEQAVVALAKPNGPLGPNTLKRVVGRLSSAIEAARRAKLVPENVVPDAKRVKGRKITIRPFSAAELRRIIAAATERTSWSLFALLGAVGCRIGEGLALDVTDLDTTAWTAKITKTYDIKYGIRAPKSEAGVRTIRIPRAARSAILAARGDRTSGPLFITVIHTRLQHEKARQRWKKLLTSLGLPYRNPHQLRHTTATHAIAAGYSLANVARDLGDTIETLVKTYIHPTEDGPDLCDAMDGLLGGGNVALSDDKFAKCISV